jgi:hypothetical protein
MPEVYQLLVSVQPRACARCARWQVLRNSALCGRIGGRIQVTVQEHIAAAAAAAQGSGSGEDSGSDDELAALAQALEEFAVDKSGVEMF